MEKLVSDPLTTTNWTLPTSNELGRMAQEVGKNANGTQQTKGTDTIFFILSSKVPKGHNVTYIRKVCTYLQTKQNQIKRDSKLREILSPTTTARSVPKQQG